MRNVLEYLEYWKVYVNTSTGRWLESADKTTLITFVENKRGRLAVSVDHMNILRVYVCLCVCDYVYICKH